MATAAASTGNHKRKLVVVTYQTRKKSIKRNATVLTAERDEWTIIFGYLDIREWLRIRQLSKSYQSRTDLKLKQLLARMKDSSKVFRHYLDCGILPFIAIWRIQGRGVDRCGHGHVTRASCDADECLETACTWSPCCLYSGEKKCVCYDGKCTWHGKLEHEALGECFVCLTSTHRCELHSCATCCGDICSGCLVEDGKRLVCRACCKPSNDSHIS